MMKLRVNPIAFEDLKGIKLYIEQELKNPIAASNTIKEIIERYEKLTDMPQIGCSLSAKTGIPSGYRYLMCGSYIAFYKIEEGYISIYRILYGKRDYLKVLYEEE